MLRKTYCRLHCSHSNTPDGLTDLVSVPPHLAPPVPDDDTAAKQRHVASLLSLISTAVSGDCPEREWQESLRILAEAMAMHWRTRSTDEIVAFMNDEVASSAKRIATPDRMVEHAHR